VRRCERTPLRQHISRGKEKRKAYRFGIAPLKVEVLPKISGVSFDEALQGSKAFELEGFQIPYIGKAALIANKKAAARHKDLADVEEQCCVQPLHGIQILLGAHRHLHFGPVARSALGDGGTCTRGLDRYRCRRLFLR
jgi:hypothetical protein